MRKNVSCLLRVCLLGLIKPIRNIRLFCRDANKQTLFTMEQNVIVAN